MDQYEVKMVYLAGHTILGKRALNTCLCSRYFTNNKLFALIEIVLERFPSDPLNKVEVL